MLGLIPLYIGGTSTVTKSFYVKNALVLSVENTTISNGLSKSEIFRISENDNERNLGLADEFKTNISLQVC